jgi:O-antigen ligase
MAWLAATVITCVAVIAGLVLFVAGEMTEATNYFLSKPGSLPIVLPRMKALMANPNMLCDYLNVSLALAFVAVAKGWLSKGLGWGCVALISIASLFTFSPGLGGLLLTAGLWFYGVAKISTRYKRLILASALAGAVTIFAGVLFSPDTLNTDQDVSIPIANVVIEPSVRVLVWENALSRLPGHLLTGRGVGGYAALISYQAINGYRQDLADAHNMWLNVLGQEGIIGLAAFAALVFYVWRRGRSSPPEKDLTLWALFCAFAGAFLYHGLSGSFEDARHLWVLVGLIAGISRTRVEESTAE